MPKRNNRPIFLDLTRINLPITAIISIAHRISGIVLFFSLPFAIYLLDLSLSGAQGFDRAQGILSHGGVKLLVIIALSALAQHVFAGLRFLFIDIGIGMDRDDARRTAWVVAVSSAAALLVIGGLLLW